jgi:hypothetical protein
VGLTALQWRLIALAGGDFLLSELSLFILVRLCYVRWRRKDLPSVLTYLFRAYDKGIRWHKSCLAMHHRHHNSASKAEDIFYRLSLELIADANVLYVLFREVDPLSISFSRNIGIFL